MKQPKLHRTDMRSEVVMVTPEIATEWLNANYQANRRLNYSHIQQLAAAMKAGHWKLTHQGAAFDTDGALIDGQHRLYAVVESGVTVPMVVTRDVPSSAFVALDQGKVRNVSDLAALPWLTPRVVAATRCMMLGPRPRSSARLELTDPQAVIAFATEHQEALRDASQWATRSSKVRNLCPAPMVGLLGRAWYSAAHEDLTGFVHVLASGVTDEPRDAIVVKLRDWLMTGAERNGDAARQLLYKKAQRALKAFLDGSKLAHLYASDDDLFPLPTKRERSRRAS